MPNSVDKDVMAKAFNEWMRRYTFEPDRYEREFQTVGKFLAEQNEGKEPSYGEMCTAYLGELMAQPLAA